MRDNENPIIKCGVQWWLFLLIGVMIGLGILVFYSIGFEKVLSNLSNEPFTSGLFLLFLSGLFFVLPLILLLLMRNIYLTKNGLSIDYLFRRKNTLINYSDIKSFKTYEGDARGISFTEICIELTNKKKIKFNSKSNRNFKDFVKILAKQIKQVKI